MFVWEFKTENKPKKKMDSSSHITPTQMMLSSGTGAMVTSLMMTPFDVVKIRLQAQQKEFMKSKCFVYCNGVVDVVCFCPNGQSKGNVCKVHGKPSFKRFHTLHHNINSSDIKHLTDNLKDIWYRRPSPFKGTLDAFVKITKNEGITSLWSGLSPTLIMALPSTVIYFATYDSLITHFRTKFDPKSKAAYYMPALAGGFARTIAATAISPIEMIRTKMQSKRLTYGELASAVKQTVKQNGLRSLFMGLNATLLRDVPFSMLYWFNYEALKTTFDKPHPDLKFSFLAGATSGSIAAILTLPFDVVKTHRQIELGEKLMKNESPSPSKMFDILRQIYQQNGFRGLYAGVVPRLLRTAPACAIMISSYEFGKAFFEEYNRNGTVAIPKQYLKQLE